MIEVIATFKDEASAEIVYSGLKLCSDQSKTKAKNYFSKHLTEHEIPQTYFDILFLNHRKNIIEIRYLYSDSNLSNFSNHFVKNISKLGTQYLLVSIGSTLEAEPIITYAYKGAKYIGNDRPKLNHFLQEVIPVDYTMAFVVAVTLSKLKTAIKLLEKGADPNIMYMEYPIIFHAVEEELFDLSIALIEAGANINIQKYNIHVEDPYYDAGNTVLHDIMVLDEDEYLNIVKLLLRKGANLNITNYWGKTPVDIAQDEEKTEFIKLLREADN